MTPHRYDLTGERLDDDEPAEHPAPVHPLCLCHGRVFCPDATPPPHDDEPRTEQGRRAGIAACRAALARRNDQEDNTA